MSEADVTDLQFVQSGFILKCILSHDITLVSAVKDFSINLYRPNSGYHFNCVILLVMQQNFNLVQSLLGDAWWTDGKCIKLPIG